MEEVQFRAVEPDNRWGSQGAAAIVVPMPQRPVIISPIKRPPTTGELIAYHRKLLKMSQETLGDAAGITGQTIAKYEKGRHVPRQTLRKIAVALKVHVLDLIVEEDVDSEEQELRDWFRSASSRDRKFILTTKRQLEERSVHDNKPADFQHRK